MKKENVNKEIIIKSVSKMIADKEIVRSYIKGKTSIQTLTKKGIKFAKPL
jgi:predicted transcriptional regulator